MRLVDLSVKVPLVGRPDFLIEGGFFNTDDVVDTAVSDEIEEVEDASDLTSSWSGEAILMVSS